MYMLARVNTLGVSFVLHRYKRKVQTVDSDTNLNI